MKNTVTLEDVNNAIKSEQDYHCGKKTTVVVLTLENGFEVLGTSACVDPANYNHEIGRQYAREDAVKKVWGYLAYELQCGLHRAGYTPKEIPALTMDQLDAPIVEPGTE